ncbi:MAG: SpoIVB peptidase [Firmicutes bacterium]|nr:SpoIVB peptidase [Bacillota bacterium]
MRNRIITAVGLCLLTVVMLTVPALKMLGSFPTEVTLFQGEEQPFDFDLPWGIELSDKGLQDMAGKLDDMLFDTTEIGSYDLSLKFMGILPMGNLRVTVIPPLELMPSGHSIAVKLSDEGVLVSGLDAVYTEAGAIELARESGFQEGDIIVAVEGKPLVNIEQSAAVLDELSQSGEELEFSVLRDGETIRLRIQPEYCQQLKKNRLGLLLRDTTAGVGTMTFYHPESGIYGALGHMITDGSGNQPVDLKSGRIVDAEIIAIEPGARGKPGEKKGTVDAEQQSLGSINFNTELGIFGHLSRTPEKNVQQALPLGLRHQVKTGKAEILTVVKGDKIERFEIEIEKVFIQNQPSSKGMVIRVTDVRLLEATGGIVQGMSGSPIIQEGKLVGAVTHVFINEPDRGYGCFAEWMVIESGLLSELESALPPDYLEALIYNLQDI